VGGGTPTLFGVDVLALPQTDPFVLHFPISLALWNGGAESVDFGSENRRKLGLISPRKFYGAQNVP